MQQTPDGGYIIAGYTSSYGAGGYDVWLTKLAPSTPVGGTIIPTDKLGLVVPWILAAVLIVVASTSLAMWNRKRRGDRHAVR